jgi:hypothetical protein
MSVVRGFVKSLIGSVVSEGVIDEIIRISYAVVFMVIYSIVTHIKSGNGVRLSIIVSLSKVFTASFMRDVFEALIASRGDGDDVLDAAGLVAETFLLKTLYGHEENLFKPPFLNPIEVNYEVYVAVYDEVRRYVMELEDKNGVAFGLIGNVLFVLLTVIAILMMIGMCQGIKSEGYPDGVRDFLDYALTRNTHMALSEMLHGASSP